MGPSSLVADTKLSFCRSSQKLHRSSTNVISMHASESADSQEPSVSGCIVVFVAFHACLLFGTSTSQEIRRQPITGSESKMVHSEELAADLKAPCGTKPEERVRIVNVRERPEDMALGRAGVML